MAPSRWSESDKQTLIQQTLQGATSVEVAKILQRSVKAIDRMKDRLVEKGLLPNMKSGYPPSSGVAQVPIVPRLGPHDGAKAESDDEDFDVQDDTATACENLLTAVGNQQDTPLPRRTPNRAAKESRREMNVTSLINIDGTSECSEYCPEESWPPVHEGASVVYNKSTRLPRRPAPAQSQRAELRLEPLQERTTRAMRRTSFTTAGSQGSLSSEFSDQQEILLVTRKLWLIQRELQKDLDTVERGARICAQEKATRRKISRAADRMIASRDDDEGALPEESETNFD